MKLNILMNKYNFNLDMDNSNSLSIILNHIKKNSIILEFGTANGRMSKYLKETMNCKVYGVEIDENSAKDAKVFCEKIIIDDVEKYTWVEEYKGIKFDYIIFADVLEHLRFPDKVLNISKSLLKNDGSIFISIPNIAHNSIIMDLLQDKFTYNSTGLLDNTHIKFFTKNTLDELIEKCNLKIAYETGVYISPEKTEFGYFYNDIDNDFSSLLANREYGEVYQFIVEAKKNCTHPVIDLKKTEISTLYFDTNDGFSENQMATTTFNHQQDSCIRFDLKESVNDVKSIRIDPIENTLAIKIKKILINDQEIKENIYFNGTSSKTHEIIFSHNDPQIIINFQDSKQIKSVTLLYDYLTKAFNVKDQQLQEKDQQLQEKDQQLQEKDQELQEKDEQLQTTKSILNNLKEEYTLIYTSASWRLTRYIRKLKGLWR